MADQKSMGDDAYLAEAVGVPPRIRHEIYRYGSDINPVQWLNWIDNIGVILVAEGRAGEGGTFHAWIAGADGLPPREITEIAEKFRFSWRGSADTQKAAVLRLCEMTALPVPDDFN
ncbi:hypothetical protein J7I84_19110 [Arthrobacter sp. ISL-85]|uniref:hypothetical protein n=1 Tax=Arthrobacter sp. ISL-85 TaxID=2819115 RepID=UPI001BE744AD|nr:hypothetical protein [Arthrobacter sp. ISL-85]MBT2568564.1 hypothetical protein [Arthrobacter sp. ISL-85]